MPVITDIKRQRRIGSNKFSISLDGEYSFALSDLDLSTGGLRIGQELSDEEVGCYQKGASEAKAYALALRSLSVRVRSRRELMDYLDRKDCERSDSEVALDRLEKLGLVDDKHFAEVWVADRQAVRPRSKQRLAQELAAKGIDRLVIDEVLNDIDPEREVLALKDLIVRKQKLSGYSDERKLLGYLQRQGYRWGLIKEALLQIKNEG